jgi:4-hydroxy-4-methyl-2-oxoglutarate aldolase
VAAEAVRRVRGLVPIAPDSRLVGPAATCACAVGDNLALHHLLATAPAGSVLVCDAGGRDDVGYFGELMALEARSRGLRGLVIDGAVRDGSVLGGLGFPVFHRGFAPGRAAKAEAPLLEEPVELGGVPVVPGDVVVADRDGVLVVPAEEWRSVQKRARRLDEEESELRSALGRGESLSTLLGLGVEGSR